MTTENNSDEDANIRQNWVAVAEETNRTLAEFAVNGLRSNDIPAVLDLQAGFFGTAGLTLRSLESGKVRAFKIMVPAEYEKEARELVGMFLGSDELSEDEGSDIE